MYFWDKKNIYGYAQYCLKDVQKRWNFRRRIVEAAASSRCRGPWGWSELGGGRGEGGGGGGLNWPLSAPTPPSWERQDIYRRLISPPPLAPRARRRAALLRLQLEPRGYTMTEQRLYHAPANWLQRRAGSGRLKGPPADVRPFLSLRAESEPNKRKRNTCCVVSFVPGCTRAASHTLKPPLPCESRLFLL